MSGCRTGTGGYPGGSVTDPIEGPASGLFRVGRGGSWIGSARRCRVSLRVYYPPGVSFNIPPGRPLRTSLGFRLLRME